MITTTGAPEVGEPDWVTFGDKVRFLKQWRDATGKPGLTKQEASLALQVWEKSSNYAHPRERGGDQTASEILSLVLKLVRQSFGQATCSHS